eukprot:Rmarinus@m.10492
MEPANGAIVAIAVVGFHHEVGHCVEYLYPGNEGLSTAATDAAQQTQNVPEEWSMLPFLAMPDGIHGSDEDAVFFRLPFPQSIDPGRSDLHCVACFRQIDVVDVKSRTDDMTRNRVQKSVCVISRIPFYSGILARLRPLVRLYFENGDFTQRGLLQQLFESLNATYAPTLQQPVSGDLYYSEIFTGLSPRLLIRRFGAQALTIVKLLMLEKRVLVCGLPLRRVCNIVLSLASLVPGLLSTHEVPPSQLSKGYTSSDLGFPLFNEKQNFLTRPYLCMQELQVATEELQQNGFLFGGSRTAGVFFNRKRRAPNPSGTSGTNAASSGPLPPGLRPDVFADVEAGTLAFAAGCEDLAAVGALSPQEKKFMARVIEGVRQGSTHSDADSEELHMWEAQGMGHTSETTEWIGSDEWVQCQFQVYFESLVCAAASIPDVFRSPHRSIEQTVYDLDVDLLSRYNTRWAHMWVRTRNFVTWRSQASPGISSLHKEDAYGTLFAGESVDTRLAGIQENLAAGVRALRLDSLFRTTVSTVSSVAGNVQTLAGSVQSLAGSVQSKVSATLEGVLLPEESERPPREN